LAIFCINGEKAFEIRAHNNKIKRDAATGALY